MRYNLYRGIINLFGGVFMDKIQLHEYFIPFKGVKKKVIYHFSDSHLTEFDALSDENEKEKAIKSTAAWENVRKGFCDVSGEGYEELHRQAPLTHFKNLLQTASDGSALIMAGDTLDYINGANIRATDAALKGYETPYIAVCGNHENAEQVPFGHALSGMRDEVQIIEFEDMVILGIDDSKRKVSSKVFDALCELFKGEKPILLAMHIPIMTEGNRERLLNSGVYFQLNYEGCPEENNEFIELVRQNSERFIAILAGHLHYPNISEVASGLTQYVSGQGITGNINRYIIGE